MKNYEIWIRESLTGKEGLVEIRTQLSIPKKSSDDFYQHLKMKKISPLNYPHPNRTPSGAYFSFLLLIFLPLGARWGQNYYIGTDYTTWINTSECLQKIEAIKDISSSQQEFDITGFHMCQVQNAESGSFW